MGMSNCDKCKQAYHTDELSYCECLKEICEECIPDDPHYLKCVTPTLSQALHMFLKDCILPMDQDHCEDWPDYSPDDQCYVVYADNFCFLLDTKHQMFYVTDKFGHMLLGANIKETK